MNLRQLKYFVTVADAGSMTRAAEILHVAQTALSMQIRQLEEDLGVPLLVRHSRGIEQTDAGRVLHARAVALLDAVEATRRDVRAAASSTREAIRLGLTPTLMTLLGVDLISTVRERVPAVDLSVVEAMSHVLVAGLQRGEMDCALCYDAPDVASLERRALLREDLVLVTAAAQTITPTTSRGIALAEALLHPLVMPEPADSVRQAVTVSARQLGLELRVAYEVRSLPAIREMAARGLAAAILPFGAVAGDVRDRRLDVCRIVTPPVRRTLALVTPAGRPPFRNEAALMGAVRTALGTLIDVLGPLGEPLWVCTSDT